MSLGVSEMLQGNLCGVYKFSSLKWISEQRKQNEHVALHKFPSSRVWHRGSMHIVYGGDALRRKGGGDEDGARKGAKQEHALRWKCFSLILLGALEHDWCHRPGPTFRATTGFVCPSIRLWLAADCRLQKEGSGTEHPGQAALAWQRAYCLEEGAISR